MIQIIKKYWYPVVVTLAVLLICMTFYAAPVKAQPICVSSECGNPHHEHHNTTITKHDSRWVVPVTVVAAAVVAIVVWIFNHEKKLAAPDPEPAKAPEPQERVLTITPDIKVYQ